MDRLFGILLGAGLVLLLFAVGIVFLAMAYAIATGKT